MAQTFNGEPGDLIEIFRQGYQHWAVYIGEQDVIHFTTDETGGQSSGSLDLLSSRKGYVLKEKFSDVVGKDRYQVNNLLDKSHKPRDPSNIVKKACKMGGRRLLYNVATYNCEHFAKELRYRKAESGQVKAVIGGAKLVAGALGVATGAAGALISGAPVSTPGAAAAGYSLFTAPFSISSSR
ncbi:phospholipase A and acyltransferase 3-like [Limanda limanda]|uniref:phospholipase A and acyltransferase 3-like n=1 Tax=Limanda limanda TaxID=27771 RepID=UPI0029C824F2|nr:phospholipase A and acyltransferase 3-like [Limanda limanda]